MKRVCPFGRYTYIYADTAQRTPKGRGKCAEFTDTQKGHKMS